jgi:large subunit ribosomal protein L23
MALNWFRKKEESSKKQVKAPSVKVVKKEKAKPAAVESASAESQQSVAAKKKHEAFKVLLRPVITEKTTYLEGGNQYCFEVSPRTNKVEIKKAIEGAFGVHVEGVRIINSKGKQVRYGRMEGTRKNRKKAIVAIKKGERIELHKQV